VHGVIGVKVERGFTTTNLPLFSCTGVKNVAISKRLVQKREGQKQKKTTFCSLRRRAKSSSPYSAWW